MPDVFTTKKRSDVMSRIRGRGNLGTEIVMRSLLRNERVSGWRRHYPAPGRPDFAFPALRLAVFVDGCFWHMCPRCAKVPATNRPFWERKLEGNVVRDRRVNRVLILSGWNVLRVWEHDLRATERVLARLRGLLAEGCPTKGRVVRTSSPRRKVHARSRART